MAINSEDTTIWTMPYYLTVPSTLSINVANNLFFQPNGPVFWDMLSVAGSHAVCPSDTWTTVTNVEGRGKLGAVIFPVTSDTDRVQMRVTIDGEISERTISHVDKYRVVLTGSLPIPDGKSSSYTGIGLHMPYFIQSPHSFDGIVFNEGIKVEMFSTGFCTSEYDNIGGTMYWLNGRVLQ